MTEEAYLGLGADKMIAFDLKAIKLANDEYLAYLFIRQGDAGRYGDLKNPSSTITSREARRTQRISRRRQRF